MAIKIARIVLAATLILTSGCSALPWGEVYPQPPTAGPSAQATAPVPGGFPEPTSTPTGTASTPTGSAPGQVNLLVWLPPEFDPNSGTPAGNLLSRRLDEFTSLRPGVHIDVRIKAVDGPGGMLDTLTAANAAAPLALPDLVALPRPLMEEAALKGLLRPLDDLTQVMEDPDWYDYARQLSRLQNSTFGLPFAGDALVMVMRTELVPEPPANWEAALAVPGPLAFPAADGRALFTLQLYLASGGPVQDGQGRPTLDRQVLQNVFSFYQQAEVSGLMPYWLTQYENDDQSWSAFDDGQANLAITWISRWLQEAAAPETALSHVPTPTGVPYTLSNGWLWSLAGANAGKHALAAELAEFLTGAEFMARWTQSAGYLPTRTSALADWRNSPEKVLLGEVILSAHTIPSADVLSSLAPPLREAVILILKEEGDPATLAETTSRGLSNP